jgi:hypothetical protein
VGKKKANHLFRNQCTQGFPRQRLDFNQIQENIAKEVIHGLAFSVTNYATGTAISFLTDIPALSLG